MELYWIYNSCCVSFENPWIILYAFPVTTARKRSLRRLCFHKHMSFCPQGGGGRAWHGGMHCRGHALQGDLCAGDMVTEAGGTHPTGMHSCHSSAFTGIKKALKTYLNHFSSFNRDTQSV